MLRINYLCGRITNQIFASPLLSIVVICSELTTFAVESPTGKQRQGGSTRCDLLRINYLCGRITNMSCISIGKAIVVICSELTTFAVESPTETAEGVAVVGCDLLRINYLCGRITNGSL